MAVDMNMSILIVDDYQTMLRVVRNLLSQIGFRNVDEATNGAQALKYIQEKKYGLVISDWNMEPMSGLDLLKAIRSSKNGSEKMPFIMVTAENKVDNVVAARQAGVNNYIVKPFSAEVLKNKITAVLGAF